MDKTIPLCGKYMVLSDYAAQRGLSLASARRFAVRHEGDISVKVGTLWLVKVGDQ